ncbi:hypothetical protein KAI56_00475 [Candidatus Parcubacteria bacterium]|nr:hypothetical protein [Candidatus Parcubacteria bacterium]
MSEKKWEDIPEDLVRGIVKEAGRAEEEKTEKESAPDLIKMAIEAATEREKIEKDWSKLEDDMYKQLDNKLCEEFDNTKDQKVYIKKLKGDLEKFTNENIPIDKEDKEFLKNFGFNKEDKKNKERILESYKKVVADILDKIKNIEIEETEKLEEKNTTIPEDLVRGIVKEAEEKIEIGKIVKKTEDAVIEEVIKTELEKPEEKLTLELMSQDEIEKMSVKELGWEIERVSKHVDFKHAKKHYEAKQRDETIIETPATTEDTKKWREQNRGKFKDYSNYLKALEKEKIKKEKEIISEEERQREAENLENEKIAQESRDKMWNRVTGIGKKIADNPEIPIEDREKLEEEKSMETVSSIMSEVNLASYEKDPRKRREMLEAAYVAMKISLTEQEIKVGRKTAELTEAKTEAVNKFGVVSEEGIREAVRKRIKKIVSKDNDQQTGESGKGWKNKFNSLKNKLSINKTKENEDDKEKFDKVKFKEAVAVEYLKILGEKTIGHLGDNSEISVKKEDHQKIIAKNLLDKYGGEGGEKELIEEIKTFSFIKEDLEKAKEKIEMDKIPEVKGFGEVVEGIESIEDLDDVIEYLEKIKKEAFDTEESGESIKKVDTLLDEIKYHKNNIAIGSEEKIKETKAKLRLDINNIDNFETILSKKEDLKKLFEGIEGLCEKKENKEEPESMNMYALPGHKVIITQEMLDGIYSILGGEEKKAEEKKEIKDKGLEIGKVYTVEKTEVHGSHTDLFLKEFPNKIFSHSYFSDVKKQSPELDKQHPDWVGQTKEQEDLGEGKNEGEITDEMRGEIKKAFEQLYNLEDKEREDIKKGFIKASGFKDREVLSLWENNSANDFVQRNKEAFEGVTVGQVMEIIEEDENNDDKKEAGKITKEMKLKIKKRIQDDKIFKSLENSAYFYDNHLKSKNSLKEDSWASEFSAVLAELVDMKLEEIENINTGVFITALKEIYEEVKREKETGEITEEMKDKYSDFEKSVIETLHLGGGNHKEECVKIKKEIGVNDNKFSIFLKVMEDEIKNATSEDELSSIYKNGFDIYASFGSNKHLLKMINTSKGYHFKKIRKETAEKIEKLSKTNKGLSDELLKKIHLFFDIDHFPSTEETIKELEKY